MNSEIKKFIEDLEIVDGNKAAIVKDLYELFYQVSKDLSEKFIYGGIGMYLGDQLIGGIYVSNKHVSLVFSRGNELTDEYSVLLGEGKWRRHITLESVDEIKRKNCRDYIEQLIALESKINSKK